LSKIMVRPKAAVPPRIELWEVLRQDPKTKELVYFTFTCVEGHFFTHYRKLGTDRGEQPFDPYLDHEEGRMLRHKKSVYR
jgi:hypothetical protein